MTLDATVNPPTRTATIARGMASPVSLQLESTDGANATFPNPGLLSGSITIGSVRLAITPTWLNAAMGQIAVRPTDDEIAEFPVGVTGDLRIDGQNPDASWEIIALVPVERGPDVT